MPANWDYIEPVQPQQPATRTLYQGVVSYQTPPSKPKSKPSQSVRKPGIPSTFGQQPPRVQQSAVIEPGPVSLPPPAQAPLSQVQPFATESPFRGRSAYRSIRGRNMRAPGYHQQRSSLSDEEEDVLDELLARAKRGVKGF